MDLELNDLGHKSVRHKYQGVVGCAILRPGKVLGTQQGRAGKLLLLRVCVRTPHSETFPGSSRCYGFFNPHWPPHRHGVSRDLLGPSLFPCRLFYCFTLFKKQGFPASHLSQRVLGAISQMVKHTREITKPGSRTQDFLTPNLGVLWYKLAAVTRLIQCT